MKYCNQENDFQIENGVLIRYSGSAEDVIIPDCVNVIGEHAFYASTTMKTLTIGDGVYEIGERAFEYCINLKKVTMSDSVTKMDWNAFAHCSHLESIRLSDNIAELDYRGFLLVNGLKEIYYNGKFPIVEEYFLLGKQYDVNTALLHWIFSHPSYFHPGDIRHAISYLEYCFPKFMKEITVTELRFLMEKGLITAKSAEEWMESLRKNHHIECLNALILYLSEKHILNDDSERFALCMDG